MLELVKVFSEDGTRVCADYIKKDMSILFTVTTPDEKNIMVKMKRDSVDETQPLSEKDVIKIPVEGTDYEITILPKKDLLILSYGKEIETLVALDAMELFNKYYELSGEASNGLRDDAVIELCRDLISGEIETESDSIVRLVMTGNMTLITVKQKSKVGGRRDVVRKIFVDNMRDSVKGYGEYDLEESGGHELTLVYEDDIMTFYLQRIEIGSIKFPLELLGTLMGKGRLPKSLFSKVTISK